MHNIQPKESFICDLDSKRRSPNDPTEESLVDTPSFSLSYPVFFNLPLCIVNVVIGVGQSIPRDSYPTDKSLQELTPILRPETRELSWSVTDIRREPLLPY